MPEHRAWLDVPYAEELAEGTGSHSPGTQLAGRLGRARTGPKEQ
jgi:hypothetical protein